MDFLVQVLVGGIGVGAGYGAVALCFVLLWNSSSVVNFATGDLVILGGFIGYTFIVQLGLPYWLGLPAAMAASFVLGVIFYRSIVVHVQKSTGGGRGALFSIVIVTLGLALLLNEVMVYLWGAQTKSIPGIVGGTPLHVAGAVINPQYVVILGVSLVTAFVLERFLAMTLVGKAMRAVAQDQEAAVLMGVPSEWVIGTAFGIAGAISALAGVLLAPVTYLVWNGGLGLTLLAFAGAVLGGFGNLRGAFIGSVIMGTVATVISAYVDASFANPSAFVLLTAVLLFKPSGIFRSAWA